MNCNGFGLTKEMLPYVPGYDLVGTIQALGEKSKADGVFRRGDRVAGVSASGGSNSRFVSIPANRLNKISDKIKSTNAGKMKQTIQMHNCNSNVDLSITQQTTVSLLAS
jgi:NADPH:quinone reductase-like Zn-dependent oxidoreductase